MSDINKVVDTKTYLLRDIDKRLWKRVKNRCVNEEETIRDYITRLIAEDLHGYDRQHV